MRDLGGRIGRVEKGSVRCEERKRRVEPGRGVGRARAGKVDLEMRSVEEGWDELQEGRRDEMRRDERNVRAWKGKVEGKPRNRTYSEKKREGGAGGGE